MFTLAFLDPGHFHAALTLRERHPLVREEIRVYARPGPELDAFLGLVQAFNARAAGPTAWRPVVWRGAAPLEQLVAERKAEAVVLAGRNDAKMAAIRRLHAAGLHVLADKPWVTGPDCLPDLEAATDGAGALAMDLMTSHHDPLAILQRRLLGEPAVFGALRCEEPATPAIFIDTVHHLAKLVNGIPLVRPPWYFDVRVQGDGIVDVPTHGVDLAQWLLAGPPLDFARDVRLEGARRWSTRVPLERFTRITRAADFPAELAPRVDNGVLAVACNGELHYRLRGVPVHVRSVWELDLPPGGSDAKRVLLRGSRADIEVLQGPAAGGLPGITVHPRPGQRGVGEALRTALARWQDTLPELAVAPAQGGGLALEIPPALRSTHEEHFALELDAFLRHVEAGRQPPGLAAGLRCKYTLLARASALADRED